MEIIIVPCTAEKIWSLDPNAGPTPARLAYVKGSFRTWVEHADAQGVPWFVLSTNHGLLPPDQEITSYNRRAAEAESDEEFISRLGQHLGDLGLGRGDRVIVLDWEVFWRLTARAAAKLGPDVCLRKLLY